MLPSRGCSNAARRTALVLSPLVQHVLPSCTVRDRKMISHNIVHACVKHCPATVYCSATHVRCRPDEDRMKSCAIDTTCLFSLIGRDKHVPRINRSPQSRHVRRLIHLVQYISAVIFHLLPWLCHHPPWLMVLLAHALV